MDMVDTEKIRSSAEKFLEKTKQHLGDETIQSIVTDGDFAETILETAKQIKADVIVMGSHSRKGLERILIGNLAEKVLSDTTVPLFVVPSK
jgi:nucleotide-binding universal stress UspA family protein